MRVNEATDQILNHILYLLIYRKMKFAVYTDSEEFINFVRLLSNYKLYLRAEGLR